MLRILIGKQEINFFLMKELINSAKKTCLKLQPICIQSYLTVKQIKKPNIKYVFLIFNHSLETKGFKELQICFLVLRELTRKESTEDSIPLHTQMVVLKGPQGLLPGEAQLQGGFCPLSISVSGMYILTNSCQHLIESVYKIEAVVCLQDTGQTTLQYPVIYFSVFRPTTELWILVLTISQHSLRL